MRFRVWFISLVLATLGVACGDQPTEVVPEQEVSEGSVMSQGPGVIAAATDSSEDGLSISTDKDDYAPGDTVWFTGAGWPANDTLDILLEDEPATHEPHTWWVPVGEGGTFRDSTYVVDVGDFGVTFTLTATSRSSRRSLTVQFTDAAPTVNSFVLNPPSSQPITVAAGSVVTVQVSGTTVEGSPGGANWRSTEVALRKSGVNFEDTDVCNDTDVVTNNSVQTTVHTFAYTVPASTGTYDVRVRASVNDGCVGPLGSQTNTAVLIVTASGPTKLGFVGPAKTGIVEQCLGAITVQTQNGSGTPTNVSSATTVDLVTDGAGAFYSDAECENPISHTTISAGGNSAAFYYKATARCDGTHQLTASATGLTSSSQVQTINDKTSQTISFPAVGPFTYGAQPSFGVAATASSGLTVGFTTQTPAKCTVAGTTVTIVEAGTCTIRASQAGDATYNPAPDVDRDVTINKADQTIDFGAIAGKTYGNSPFSVSATATSTLPVSFALGAGSVGCSLSGAMVTITAATGIGQSCIIAASQAGSVNYNAAPSVNRQFSIARANLALAVDDKSRLYGQNNPALTGTLTGVAYDDNITASYSTTATQNSDVGTYPITATLNDPNSRLGNYNVPSPMPQGELEITPAPLTVAAEDKQKDYDGQAFTPFTAEYTGFALGQNPNVLSGTLGFSGSAVGAVNAGSYTITPGGLTSSNYTITFQNGTLTINKVTLTVTAVNREKVFDGQPYPFNTDRGATTDVTYSGFVSSEGPSVLTGTLSFSAAGATAVGTYTNTPGGLGATNYAIAYAPGTLKILAWTLAGYYQPVDMSTGGLVWNTVKGGSTVPLKFNVYQATTIDPSKERTDVGAVQSFAVAPVSCNSSTVDAIEFTTTGGTSLRYDTTDRQFIQNWQTPRLAGTCHRVIMTTIDGSKLEAYFKLK